MLIGFHVICVICSSIWPFLFCYFATFATYRVAAIAQAAYDSNWLDLPPRLQKYIILIITRSQETIHFTGFGLFSCTLEVLGKVRILFFSSYKFCWIVCFFSSLFSSSKPLVLITLFSDALRNVNMANQLQNNT